MDLLKNPFHILTATTRDNRQRIIELADDRSLLHDSNECMEARSDLTNPRKRLSAEIAWLPGIGPQRAGEVLDLLESSVCDVFSVKKLTPIARANLISAGLSRLPDYSPHDVAVWIIDISWAFEVVDSEGLNRIINEERVVSGFPEVTDPSLVETEIQERRRYYIKVIKHALDKLTAGDLVIAVTDAVESATYDGEKQGPILIDDLVDSYEVEALVFLKREEENINILVEKIRTDADAGKQDSKLIPIVNQLIQVVKNWDTVAQPIQVSKKSRGLNHDDSQRVAASVRELALHLFNEHDKLDLSKQLTNMLQEVFLEVVDIAELTGEDASTLDEIAEQRVRLIEDAKNQAKEWREEITYEADIGAIFKDKLSISPEGINWKKSHWNLDSITRIRWGGTRHSLNGIPTGTTYSIFLGNDIKSASIDLKKESIYSNFIDRLWRSVGVRLLTEYLQGLKDGKKYWFGSALMSDQGMELERKKLFSTNERVFCEWDELSIWNGGGSFCIGKKNNKKLSADLSYQEEDNIHVLEAGIRMFWKKGGDKLSSILGE
jgi:hypothetical protein